MPSAKYELFFLNEALKEMTRFLLSKSLYWPLGLKRWPGEPPYPRLTLGTLLLSRARLQAFRDEVPAEAADVDEKLDNFKNRWAVIYQNKAAAEFPVRLRRWNALLDERTHPQYANSVRLRVILHLLTGTLEKPPGEGSMLDGLDVQLRRLLVHSDFVWDAELAPAFPQEPYWYLWGLPRKPLKSSPK
jgi:hypothetical protein